MKRILCIVTVLAVAGRAAALVSERWGPKDVPCSHPGTLKVLRDQTGLTLLFDLSALPTGAKIQHASLYCFTQDNRQPREPAGIAVVEKLRATDSPFFPPLQLEPPWYRSFDATAAVKAWAAEPEKNLGLRVDRFEGLVAGKSYLEVRHEGGGGQVPEQVTGLRAVHHDGQTFLVWAEHKAFRPPADSVVYVSKFSRKGNEVVKAPGAGWRDLPRVPAITLKTLRQLQGMELRDKESGFQGIRPAQQVRQVPEVRYRVYRHARRITAENIHEAEWVGVAEPLNAYDQKMAVISFKGEYIDQKEVGGSIIPASCVEDGKPIQAGEAIYVHNPAAAGKFYYAVTTALGGTENLRDVGDANSLAEPVAETPAAPKPVLQRLQEIQYGAGIVERWYLFWAAPPYANLPNRPLHVLVGEPEGLKPPLPMVIDGFHGGFNIVGAMRVPAQGALTLLVEHQIGYGGDGDLLYNEGLGTLRSYRQCKVRYFSEKYFLRLIDWAMRAWQIDRARVYGGQHDSGPLHLGVRHPEVFKRVFLGNYTASYEYTWSPPSRGLVTVLGPRELAKTPDGQCAWDVLDLSWYLKQDPGKDIPLIWGGSNTGKDSGHTSEFGWQDDPRGWWALQQARQPFVIAWGVGHADPGGSMGFQSIQPEVMQTLASRRWETTIPAFSNCSLNDNPGNGDPADGCFCGQMNGYLTWQDDGHVDQKDRWEMTLRVVNTCPEDSCTADVTPRHCRGFKPGKGEKFKWTNTSLADNEAVGSGTVTADQWGLVTVEAVKVTKRGNRISIHRQ